MSKGRPQYLPIDWAADAAISGAPAGNGLAPTLRPSAGYIGQGFHPLEPAEARKLNYVLREHSQRDAYVDMIDAQNWHDTMPLIDLGAGTPNAIRGACALTWHSSRRMLVVGNGEDCLESYDGGYTWEVAFTDAGGQMLDCCTRDENAASANNFATAVLMYDGANVRIAMRGTSGAGWAQTTIATADVGMLGTGLDHAKVIPDPYIGGFWVGGQTAANAAVFRIVDVNGAYSSQAALAYAPLIASNITSIAKGPTHGVAASWSGAAGILYRWANADAALSAVTHPDAATGRVLDIVWSPTDSMFLLFVEDASGFLKLYRSATGATGTWVVQSMGAVNAFQGIQGAACVRGSVIMMPCYSATPTPDRYWIAYSCDAGANWELIPNPIIRHATTTGYHKIDRLRLVDRRFAAFSYSASGDAFQVYSLRTGRELSTT